MTQQVFADFIGLAPATLSSIYNERTRPTLSVVEAIKKKIPNISTDWLMFGSGDMYISSPAPADSLFSAEEGGVNGGQIVQNPMFDFDQSQSPTPQQGSQAPYSFNSVKSTRPEIERTEVKVIDKPQRKVKEIRVFYDDQTWETFVPEKKLKRPRITRIIRINLSADKPKEIRIIRVIRSLYNTNCSI